MDIKSLQEQNKLEEDYQLINHFIKQMGWSDIVFAYLYSNTKSGKVIAYKNYFERKSSILLDSLNNDSLINEMNVFFKNMRWNDKEKLHFLYNCHQCPRMFLSMSNKTIAIINVKVLIALKKIVLENDFFSLNTKTDFLDAQYYFYRIFLFETKALLDLYSEKNLTYLSSVPATDYLQIAPQTLHTFLKFDLKERASLVFEYFFILYSHIYHSDSQLSINRLRLMESLANNFKKIT
ncbi:hypothetical protein HNQ34_003033 [Anoxybacillus tepidamans]|uniref:Uncharacterized protein n=1 Tax=Anoxybacteroides tepidamans TaxID=265948 RepID=A0A7W8IUB0_9BACL|nr:MULTISPECIES: hypothetical protein [Bacillaceae]AMQ22064.1 hypothetical protein A0V43_15710 [Geobacillus sp. JS12]MBB5325927.1 hypothetical protein [Anoxybacillus tepidamans]